MSKFQFRPQAGLNLLMARQNLADANAKLKLTQLQIQQLRLELEALLNEQADREAIRRIRRLGVDGIC